MTATFALGALVLIFAAGWLIDRRGASAADRRLADLARKSGEPPLDLMVRAARASRIVFLADIDNSAATKEFAANAITRIASSPGLDAVVVEVGADQQPYLDQYFDRAPEDAGVLMAHERTLRGPGGATRAYLALYHVIWKLNEKLGPDERIRVIAADLPGWPPTDAASPAEMARLMGERSAAMAETVNTKILGTIPSARILVFMTGFQAMKSGAVDVQTGGTTPVSVKPLAERLAEMTEEVFTILVDAPSTGSTGREIAPYLGTRVSEVMREAGVSKPFALQVTREFDYLRHPLIERKTPGVEFNVTPDDYRLRDVADAYVSLGH